MLRALLGAAMVLMFACQIHAQAANCDFVMYQNRSFDCDKNDCTNPYQIKPLHCMRVTGTCKSPNGYAVSMQAESGSNLVHCYASVRQSNNSFYEDCRHGSGFIGSREARWTLVCRAP